MYRLQQWLPEEKKQEFRQYRWTQMTVAEARAAGIAYIDGVKAQLDKVASIQKQIRQGRIPLEIIDKAIARRKNNPKPSWKQLAVDLSTDISTRIAGGYIYNDDEWVVRCKDSSGGGGASKSSSSTSNNETTTTTSSSSSSSSSNTTEHGIIVTADGLRKAAARRVTIALLDDDIEEEDEEKQQEIFAYHTSLMEEQLHFYKVDRNGNIIEGEGENLIDMVEVHVDLLDVTWRQNEKYATFVTIHDVKVCMGGKLSVRYNQVDWKRMFGEDAILPPPGIKIGTDEVNFKMYAMAKKYWIIDGIKKIAPKNDGKGNMKVAWIDEIFGLAYNHLPTDLLTKFQETRPKRNISRDNGIIAYNPAFIQWEYNVKQALASGDLTKGYWTSDLMLEATEEYLDLFYFLYGGPKVNRHGNIIKNRFVSECKSLEGEKLHHVPIINMDWSSNHAAKSDDCLTSTNFRRTWGTRFYTEMKRGKRVNTDKPKLSPRGDNPDGSVTLKTGDICPGLPDRAPSATYPLLAGEKQFMTFQFGDAPPFFFPDAVDYVGQDKGLDQLLYERGYDVKNMTMQGRKKKKYARPKKKSKAAKAKAKKKDMKEKEEATKFIVGDLVIVKYWEPGEDEEEIQVPYLFRVIHVPSEHTNVNSQVDLIRVERMKKQFYDGKGAPDEGTRDFYCNDATERSGVIAEFLTDVNYLEEDVDFKIIYGGLERRRKYKHSTNKFHCVIAFDFDADEYLKKKSEQVDNADEEDDANEDNDANEDDDVDKYESEDASDTEPEKEQDSPLPPPDANAANKHASGRRKKIVILDSLVSVFENSPSVKNSKSLIQKLVEKRGGVLIMSAKFHPECAGVGVEYCFGRCKWYFKKNHVHSTQGLRRGSELCFDRTVVSLHHTRRFARKSRDYQRAYRAGSMGLLTNNKVKIARTHRSALDTDYTFVGQPEGEDGVSYGDTDGVLNKEGRYYADIADSDDSSSDEDSDEDSDSDAEDSN